MTRKHFEAIARNIAWAMQEAKDNGNDVAPIANMAKSLAYDLSGFNPHFNRDKFLKACGL